MDFSQFTQSDLILIIIGGAIVLWILYKIGKNLFKIAAIVFVVILIYLVWSGNPPTFIIQPSLEQAFKHRNVDQMYERHCTVEKKDKALCACVIEPVYNDLHKRLRPKEIEKLDNKQMADEVMKSYKRQQDEMHQCLKDKNESKMDILKKLKEAYNVLREDASEN